MKQLVYFLIVGLAVIALQATTVEAQGGDPNMPPPTGAPGAPPMGDPNMPPPTGAPGAPPMGDAAAKPSLGERVKSFFGMGTQDATPPAGDPGMPPTGAPGEPPMDGPPPGEDCANKPTPEETAACWEQQGGHMDHPGGPPMGDPNMPPAGQ